MNCCFVFSALRTMEVSDTKTVSLGELSRKTKMSQAMSRSLSAKLDDSQNPLTLTPDYNNLPELKTDKEIEDVLCKISELLTSNSRLSSGADLDDSRSIEEILREAEEIVRDNSSHYEDDDMLKSSRVDGCNLDALSDRTECSVELEQEHSKHLSNNNSLKENQHVNEQAQANGNCASEPSRQANRLHMHSINNHIDTIKRLNAFVPNSKRTEEKMEKHLTLKDLDVPDRPKNLDLPSNIIQIEPSRSSNMKQIVNLEKNTRIAILKRETLSKTTSCTNQDTNRTPSNQQISTGNEYDSAAKSNEKMDESSSIGKEAKLINLGIIVSNPASPKELPSVHNHHSKSCAKLNTQNNSDNLKKVYEEKIFDLERQIRILSSRLSEMEKSEEKSGEAMESERMRLSFLEKEVKSQEELIAGYQRENQRLLSEGNKARKVWTEAERMLGEKVKRLERELKRANTLNTTEAFELKEALAEAREELTRLEEDSITLKNEKRDLEKRNCELAEEMKRLRCESDGYRAELELLRIREKERDRRATAEASLASANLQGKLSQANSELTKKQTEVVRLNTEVTRLRGELERARLGSVVTGETNHSHSTSHQVRQLEIALERERDNARRALSQLESVNKHNLDLARQVKELELIVKRRSKSGGGIPWGDETPSTDLNKFKSELEIKTRKLEQQLVSKDKQLSDNLAKLNDLQNKYDKEVNNLQEKIQVLSRRSSSSTSLRSNPRNPPQSANNDTQLLATIRGLKAEIATKDKQLMKITRELDDTKKKMARNHSVQMQQTHNRTSLNNNRPNSNLGSKNSDTSSCGGTSTVESGNASKNYNPFLFEEDRETILFLRNENANLHEEVKKLEQDLINLHNKRIQDLSELESNHSAEVKRALREHTVRQANSQITHLRGQVYTQQMVINHLKNQIKALEQKNQEVAVLKAERDQLEGSLLEANKKVATLHQLSSPGSNEYSSLLEKLERLERRHELREAKLQGIVKELVARQQTSNVCNSASCKDKLYNKNREICYYRAEIDKILDSLTEFKYIK